jgi:hypothetical protein
VAVRGEDDGWFPGAGARAACGSCDALTRPVCQPFTVFHSMTTVISRPSANSIIRTGNVRAFNAARNRSNSTPIETRAISSPSPKELFIRAF